jgi:hypothetical protein
MNVSYTRGHMKEGHVTTVRQSHREWREILVFMGKPKGGTLWVLAMNSGFPPFPVDFV